MKGRARLSDVTSQTRTERRRERRAKHGRVVALVAGTMVILGVIGAVAILGGRLRGVWGWWSADGKPPLASAVSTAAASHGGASGQVEVPALRRMTLLEAKALLVGAGLKATVKVDRSLPPAEGQRVSSQQPSAGSIVRAGSTVTLVVSPAAVMQAKANTRSKQQLLVVIDPAHQSVEDTDPEPVGPGASSTAPRCTRGAVGVASGVPECELNRQLATLLQTKLAAMGIQAVLTRSTDDVYLSDAERGAVARRAKATLFVRIEAQTSTDARATGIQTLSPQSNQWTKKRAATSLRAALAVQQNVVAATGAEDLGTADHDDPVFNYCSVPCVAVETGFLSNSVEDKLLCSAEYQDRVCQGVANGISEFLDGGE